MHLSLPRRQKKLVPASEALIVASWRMLVEFRKEEDQQRMFRVGPQEEWITLTVEEAIIELEEFLRTRELTIAFSLLIQEYSFVRDAEERRAARRRQKALNWGVVFTAAIIGFILVYIFVPTLPTAP